MGDVVVGIIGAGREHSFGCYLAALAAADFLFLLLHLVFEMQSAWGLRTLNAPVICEAFPVIFLALQYMSPLLVLAFTVERSVKPTSSLVHLCNVPQPELIMLPRNNNYFTVVITLDG